MVTPSTFRHDLVAGIVSMLNGVKTAHPTLLVAVYPARPESFPDFPCAFVDDRPEAVTQDEGTRTRNMTMSFLVVRRPTTNAETMAANDVLIDYIVDAVTANPQYGTTGMHSGNFTVAGEETPIGDFLFPAVRFTLTGITIMEGRI